MDDKMAEFLQQKKAAMEKELSRIIQKQVISRKEVYRSIQDLKNQNRIPEQCADLLRYTYTICALPKAKLSALVVCSQNREDIEWALDELKRLT